MKYFLCLIMFLPCVLFAQETPVYFTVSNLKSIDCAQNLGNRYSAVISGQIRQDKGFSLNADDAAKTKSTVYRSTGAITFVPVKKDDKSVTKYISEESRSDKYIVTINVVDGTSGAAGAGVRGA